MQTYGTFKNEAGGFTITKLPPVGSYEYILKNDDILVKLDQFGLITAQINPPVGEAVFKREEREVGSPVKTYFSDGSGLFSNFDVFRADKLTVDFTPQIAAYTITFGKTEVKTEIFVPEKGKKFVVNVTISNKSDKQKTYSVLKCSFPYLNELLMAPWDKPEWYTRTEYLKQNSAFLTTKFSVAGKVEERRFLTVLDSIAPEFTELSLERLTSATKNFSVMPEKIGGETENVLYAFKQCAASLNKVTLGGGESYSFTQVYSVTLAENEIDGEIKAAKNLFDKAAQSEELKKLKIKYEKLFSVRTVSTKNAEFDKFVNGFLPLEMYWVSSLDRGWPTGMRGVRDAANDFEGMLCYDEKMCRSVIENIFSKQRSDGWYPRQVPFGSGTKFDLRGFVDSACFFTEYVYDYLAYTGDYTVLESEYGYYDSDEKESGLTHLIKGMDYLIAKDALGKHGLVKMRGGDWLDCLSGVGKQGKGESVMVSCQLITCLEYLTEILVKSGKTGDVEKYKTAAENLKNAVNKYAFNGKFYNAVYTDNDTWLLSDKDEDGKKRVYVPTNAYAVISGVADGKEDSVFAEIKNLKTSDGYKLFSVPLGEKFIDGIGKMGTGDFQPYFAENGSVYNHGSQCFLIRALAKAGRYEDIYDVLGYAMPVYADKHSPDKVCAAPYAITNCYHLVPSFYGRAGFSFLTGSVAMIERAIYSWVFGINFTLSDLVITPCVPKEYANAVVTTPFNGHKLTVKYVGFGATVKSASISGAAVSGAELKVDKAGRSVIIDKKALGGDAEITIILGTTE